MHSAPLFHREARREKKKENLEEIQKDLKLTKRSKAASQRAGADILLEHSKERQVCIHLMNQILMIK